MSLFPPVYNFSLQMTDVREAYAMGVSEPSGRDWDITVPTPYTDASPAKTIGKAGLKWANTGADVILHLAMLNTSERCFVHCHLWCFCKSSGKGRSIEAKLDINLHNSLRALKRLKFLWLWGIQYSLNLWTLSALIRCPRYSTDC